MKTSKSLLCALVAVSAGLLSMPSSAVTYSYVNQTTTPTQYVSSVFDYQVFGNEMAGLVVTATFANAGAKSAVWTSTGNAIGNGWSLSLSGDSDNVGAWSFSGVNWSQLGALTQLKLDGVDSGVVFDRYMNGAYATSGSKMGKDFTFDPEDAPALGSLVAKATYDIPVALEGTTALRDIWSLLTVDFSSGISQDFSFTQDTDRVPEPGTLLLMSIGLLGLGLSRRNKA